LTQTNLIAWQEPQQVVELALLDIWRESSDEDGADLV
jgi:hypothetical protein